MSKTSIRRKLPEPNGGRRTFTEEFKLCWVRGFKQPVFEGRRNIDATKSKSLADRKIDMLVEMIPNQRPLGFDADGA